MLDRTKKALNKKLASVHKPIFLYQEKRKLTSLFNRQRKYLKELKNVDDEIIAIQRSTRTLLPQMATAHNYLRMRYKWYYNWHRSEYASKTHWTALTGYMVTLFAVIFSSMAPVTMASSTKTWDFATAGDYTYDSSKIEVAGGVAQPKVEVNPGVNWIADEGGQSWQYRRAITVNNTGGELSNYPVAIDEGLKMRWALDEASATTAADSSGSGTYGNPTGTSVVAGKFSNGRNFNGSSYLDLIGTDAINFERTDTFSFSSWIKTTSTNYGDIISRIDNSGSFWYGIELAYCGNSSTSCAAGSVTFRLFNSTNSTSNIKVWPTTGGTVNDGNWHQVTATYDGSSTAAGMHIYVDGIDQSLSNNGGSLPGTINYGTWEAGTMIGGGNRLYGALDELRVYNRVLPQEGVTALQTNGAGYLASVFSTANASGNDIRFTSSDGVTSLKYWFAYYSQTNLNARIFVNVPTVAASGNTTIYMYYGNSAAAAGSDPTAMTFADNFDDASLDATKWPTTTRTPTESGGNLVLDGAGDTAANRETVFGNTSITAGQTIEIKQKSAASNQGGRFGITDNSDIFSAAGADSVVMQKWTDARQYTNTVNNGTNTQTQQNWYNGGIFYTYKLHYKTTAATTMCSEITCWNSNTNVPDSTSMKVWLSGATGTQTFDYVAVYPYVAAPPTVTVVGAASSGSYPTDDPTVVVNTGQTYATVSGFSATLGGGSTGTIQFQISPDNGATWYWYTTGAWATTTAAYAESNTAADVNSNISTFTAGSNPKTFKFKAFFHSDGTQQPKLDAVDLTYKWDSVAPNNPGSVSGYTDPRTDTAWNMNTSTDYTYDGAKVEFAGGSAQLKGNYTPGTDWIATGGTTNWKYRVPITVNNGSGGTLSNYQVKIDEGLREYWNMDGNANDTSGYGNNGSVTGAVSNPTAKFSQGYDFDGNDVITSTRNSGIAGNPTFSISIWFKVSSLCDCGLGGFGQGGGTLTGADLALSSAGAVSLQFAGVNGAKSNDGVVTTGSWHHLAAVKTPGAINTTTTLYLDGNPIGISTASTNTPNIVDMPYSVGRFLEYVPSDWFSGSLDDFRVYDRALTASDISSLYANNLTGTFGTVYANANASANDIRFTDSDGKTELNYWKENYTAAGQNAKFWVKVPSLATGDNTIYMYYGNSSASAPSNQISNTFVREVDSNSVVAAYDLNSSAVDSSGNYNNGTVTGATATASGKYGSAYSFDGNDVITSGSNSGISGDATFSIEAWFKASSIAATGACVAGFGTAYVTAGAASACIGQSGYVSAAFAGGKTAATADGVISPGNWYHFVVTKSPGAINTTTTIYINGSSVALAGTPPTDTPNITNAKFNIGRFVDYTDNTAYNFNGIVDHVRFYNKALSAAEVSDLYNNYGYVTPLYANKELVRAYNASEPTMATSAEATLNYATDNPTVVVNAGQSYSSLYSFAETLGSNSAGNIKYVVSPDNGSTWYWWNTSAWASTTAGYTESNTAADINSNISTFTAGSNPKTFKFKAFLNSDGTQQPKLDNITVNSSTGSDVTGSAWQTDSSPWFTWSAPGDGVAPDGELASGIAGYYVYFGTDVNADPATAGGYQVGTSYTGTASTNNATYYLRLKTKDVAGNVAAASTLFSYNYYTGPTVTSISPTSGTAGGGTAVTITGSDFKYTYERPITISNTSGGTLTDYQVVLTIDTTALVSSGKMTVDGHDIRIKNNAKDTDLSFWIEPNTFNTASTKIWIKIPSVPAGSSTIYLQYGDASLAVASSTSDTFVREIPDLLANWKFDENTGATLGDSSGNNHVATAYGSPAWVDGKFGKALSFFSGLATPTDMYVKTDADVTMNENFTVLAWVNPHAYTGNDYAGQRIFETGVTDHMGLVWNPGGFLVGWTYNDSKLTTGLTPDQWQFTALRYDGLTKYVTNNGVSASKSVVNSGTVTKPLYISRNPSGATNAFQGAIDEPAVFSRSLSDAELSDIYNNYGYTTPNYPGKMLVKKALASGEPTATLSGSESKSTPTVTFDGVSATSITGVNSTTITAVTPAHAEGVVDVAVSTTGKSGTLPGAYTYTNLPPAAPSNVSIGSLSTTGFTVTWTDNASDETGYKVYISTTPNADCSAATYPGTPDYTPAANAASQAVTGKSVNTQYCVKVAATNAGGDTPAYSAPVYTYANVPGAPTIGSATGSTLKATINENSNPSNTQYAIGLDQDSNGSIDASSYVQANGSLGASAAWQTYAGWGGASGITVTGLTASTTYKFKVYARNGDNQSTTLSAEGSGSTTTPAIGFTTTSAQVGESTTSYNIQVSIQNASSLSTSANYAVTGGTATGSGTDYTLASGTATITPGNTSTNIALSVANDTLDENDETIILTLSAPTNATLGANTTFTYTVQDDDASPTIGFSSTTGSGAESVGTANLAVTLSAASGRTVTVDYATADGIALAGSDYTAKTATLTFSPGETSKNATVAITDDTLDENDETFSVTLSNPTAATLDDPEKTETYTIQDNDNPPTVTLSVNNVSIAEADGTSTVTATLDTASAKNVTVNLAFSGTATNISDYTRSGASILIGAGATSNSITLSAVDDSFDENDETIIVDISSVTNGTESGVQQQTVTIIDDEDMPIVQFNDTVASGSEATSPASITVSLSAGSGRTVTVDYTTSNGTAVAGSDYTVASGTLTFSPYQLNATIDVPITNDVLDENDETFMITLYNPTNVTIGASNPLTYTILDDESNPTVTLSTGLASIAETGGSTTVTATLSTISGRDVTVSLAFTGTATNTADYTRTADSIVISAGSLSNSITVSSVSDLLDEANETVVVDIDTITNGTESGTQQQTITITDDDNPPQVTLELSGSPLAENGGVVTVTARLDAPSGLDVTVNLAFTGTATNIDDYTRSGASIAVGAGTTSNAVTLTGVNDALEEGNETIIVDISSVNNGTESGTQQVTATITDDEKAAVPSDVAIGSLATDGFTVTWTDNSSTETDFKVFIAPGNVDCSAATYAGTPDFTTTANAVSQAVTGKSINTQYCAKVIVANANGDSAAVYSTPKYTLASVPAFTLAAGDYSVADGYHLDTVINANGNPGGTNYWVQYSTDNAAYLDPSGMAWQSGTDYTLKKTSTNADLAANTQYWVKVRAKNGDGVATGYSASSADVTPPAAPDSLSISNICSTTASSSWAAVTGANTYMFSYGTDTDGTNLGATSGVATTNKNLTGLSDGTTYYWKVAATSTANGTGAYSAIDNFATTTCLGATAPIDFAGSASSATAIHWTWSDVADNETGYAVHDVADTSISGDLAADTISYDESSLSVNTAYTRHVNTFNAIGDNDSNQATVWTLANVPGAPTTQVSSATAISIKINTNSNPDANTRYAIYNETDGKYVKHSDNRLQDTPDWQLYADWGGASGFLNIGLSASKTYSYKVKAINGDLSRETALSAGGSATTTQTVMQFLTDSSSGSESTSSATIAVRLAAASSLITSADYIVTGTATGGGVDYTLASGTVSITAGQQQADLNLSINNDLLDELDETVVVTLSNPTNCSLDDSHKVYTYTILDNDNPPSVTLSVDNSTIAENGGVATVTATLSAASGQDVTVNLAYVGNATNVADYIRSDTSMLITAGDTTGSVAITGVDDTLDEADEVVGVQISTVDNGTESGSQQVNVTITDDDLPPTITLGLAGSPLAEDNGIATVTATLSAVSGKDVTANLTFAGTASNVSDYVRSDAAITILAGNSTGTITLTGVNDSIDENDETIQADIDSVLNATESGSQSVTATITDDDLPPTVTLEVHDSPMAENGGTSTITARLDALSGKDVTVNLGFAGTATNSSDYNASGTSIVIGRGTSSNSITLTGVDDSLDEEDETVITTIDSVVNGAESGVQSVTAVIADDDTAPTVQFSSTSSSNLESVADVSVQIELSTVSGKVVSIPYTVSGTATGGGVDYTRANGTAAISAGETTVTIPITIANDALDENDETIILSLYETPVNATLGTNKTYTYTITDDDAAPTVTLNASAASIAEHGGSSIVTAELSAVSGKTVTVNLGYTGTATNSADYDRSGEAIVILPGNTTGAIVIASNDDTIDEDNETVIVDITSVTNGTESGTQQTTVTILDDDAAPTISFSSAAVSGLETNANPTLVVSLSNLSAKTISVDCAVISGTATRNTDYTFTDGTATIAAGQSQATIQFTVTDDGVVEPDETVIVGLSNPTNATLGSGLSATYTITNDDQPPTSNVSVNDGATKTNENQVTVTLDSDKATDMKVSTNPDLSGAEWEAYQSTKTVDLASGDGAKAVYVQYRDQYGNESAVARYSITLDTVAPIAPTNLAAQAGNTSISLSWTNPAEADFAKTVIYRSSESAEFVASSNNMVATVNAPVQTYTDSGVENNVTYYYKLKALDDANNYSGVSLIASAKPDSDLPTTPGKPSIAERIMQDTEGRDIVNTKIINLAWSPSIDTNSGLKSYYLSIGTTSGGSEVEKSKEILISDLLIQETPAVSYQLQADGTYYIRITAKDALGNISAVSPELVAIIDTIAPTRPSEALMYDASDRTVGTYAVLLAWKTSLESGAGLKGYQIKRNGQLIGAGVTSGIKEINLEGLDYYLDLISVNVPIRYTIRAIDLAGNQSSEVDFVVAETASIQATGQKAGDTTITIVPTILGQGKLELGTVTTTPSDIVSDTTQAVVTWETSVPANSWIRYGRTENYTNETPKVGMNTEHTVVLSDLQPNTTYHFQAISVDSVGAQVSSIDQSFTTKEATKQEGILEIILNNIIDAMSRIWGSVRELFSFGLGRAYAADSAIAKLSVINISTPTRPAMALYWPAEWGAVKIERSENEGGFVEVVSVNAGCWMDTTVKAGVKYTYRIGNQVGLATDEFDGKPSISDIKITPGLATKDRATAVIQFQTDRLAKSQLYYGESQQYGSKTAIREALNQHHTIMIDDLRPNTAYHFKVIAESRTGSFVTESEDIVATTTSAPEDLTIFQIILRALQNAFSGFDAWISN